MDSVELDTSTQKESGVAFANITEGYQLTIREPGAYKLQPRRDMHFLDIQVGGTKGQYSVEKGEARFDISPVNSFVFLPSNDIGKVTAIRSGWSVQLMFLPERMDRIIAELWPNSKTVVHTIWHEHDDALIGIAKCFKDVVCACHGAAHKILNEDFVTGLLAGTALHFQIQYSDDMPRTESMPRVQTVLRYIEENLDKSLLVEELATLVNVSPYHFSRMFRSVTSSSIRQYVIRRRLEHAKNMLLRSDMSISRISYECGFGSQSHMTTVFSKTHGTTPGAMRRRQICQ